MNKGNLLSCLFPFLNPRMETGLDQADLVICSVFSKYQVLRDLKKRRGDRVQLVQFTGESRIADKDHNYIDFTIGSDREGPKDCMCPLSLIYYRIARNRLSLPAPAEPRQRKFAIIVCSDRPERQTVYSEIIQYRNIDGYGRMFGRKAVGRYWDQAYIDLLSQYKFVLCLENGIRPGYHSEKIVNALLAGCVPIYMGASTIDRVFSRQRFVGFESTRELDGLLDSIRRIDSSDSDFSSMLEVNPWAKGSWTSTDQRWGSPHAVERLSAHLTQRGFC